jgi:hypothetical protein
MECVLLWPALSAGAILLERITSHGPAVTPAPYHFDSEEECDVLLRKENHDAVERGV